VAPLVLPLTDYRLLSPVLDSTPARREYGTGRSPVRARFPQPGDASFSSRVRSSRSQLTRCSAVAGVSVGLLDVRTPRRTGRAQHLSSHDDGLHRPTFRTGEGGVPAFSPSPSAAPRLTTSWRGASTSHVHARCAANGLLTS